MNEKPIVPGSVPRLESEGVTGWSNFSAPITVAFISSTSGGSSKIITPATMKIGLKTCMARLYRMFYKGHLDIRKYNI